jgi:SAM-dependent methyltransferase
MIELANKYNRKGHKCKYYVNAVDSLILFPDRSFDFIYSKLTLQHMRPRYSKRYLREFLAKLAPGGLLVFQMLSDRKRSNKPIRVFLRHIIPKRFLEMILNGRLCLERMFDNGPKMEMYVIKKETIESILRKSGGQILDIKTDCTDGSAWMSLTYYVRKE